MSIVLNQDEEVIRAAREDLRAVKARDQACVSFTHCLTNLMGFQALQSCTEFMDE